MYKRQVLRLSDGTLLTGQVNGDPLEVVGTFGGSSGGASGEYAVSYTHLRAHETVLDLVCRLLLEKTKKTKKKKKIIHLSTSHQYCKKRRTYT